MLRKVRIQNFKSLKDVTLELQKVNLLIGPNNSGKSNFLKGLEKLKLLSFGKSNEKSKKIVEESEFNNRNSELNIHIALEMAIKIEKTKKVNKCEIEISKDGVLPISRWQESENYPNQKLFSDIDTGLPIEKEFISFFRNLEIYQPNPNLIIIPQALSSTDTLNGDCSNLITFLLNLMEEHEKTFKQLQADFAKCVIDFVEIKTPAINTNEGGKLSLKFRDKDGVDFLADEVSDGVIYFLALLCIIHQPNPPKLLLLEEPEKGIHPRRIREVIDFIFQLVEEKDIQVIMTTHSERVLDEFEDIPESVFVFDKDEEGATQVKNLLKDIIEPSNIKMESLGLPRIKFTESLGSHWVTGFIGGVPK